MFAWPRLHSSKPLKGRARRENAGVHPQDLSAFYFTSSSVLSAQAHRYVKIIHCIQLPPFSPWPWLLASDKLSQLHISSGWFGLCFPYVTGRRECRGLAQQDIVFPRLLSLRLHDGASRLVQLVALFAFAFAFAHSINPISDSAPPPPRCPVTAVPWIPAGTPILVPPQNHPPPPFSASDPPHSPIPRSGFDADQAGITAQVCVHCGIGIPIRLICTTASDEPGTYPHTFSTAHSPSPTSQSSRGFTFFSPHTHHLSPCAHLAPRTSHLAVPASFVSLPTSSPNLLPPPDCLPQQGAVLTPSPPQPVRRPLESPPLSLDAIPSTRLREGRKRVQRLRVGPRVASTHKLFFFFATRRRTTIHSSYATTLSPKRLQHTHAGLDSASVGERIEGALDAVH